MYQRLISSALGFSILATALTGCSGAKPPGPSARVKEFLGDKTVAILSGADKVEVYRLGDWKDRTDPKKPEASAGERLGGYPVAQAGKEQGKEFASRLASLLFSDKTYLFDMAKGCVFAPGVGFRVWQDKESVEVLLCFTCDEVQVLRRDADGNLAHQAHEDFDPARRELVKLAKEALPEDRDIQGLKE